MTKLNILQGLAILFCFATLIFVVAFAWIGGLAYLLASLAAFSAAALTLVAYEGAFLNQRFNERLDALCNKSLGV